jgi:hypothetical protein
MTTCSVAAILRTCRTVYDGTLPVLCANPVLLWYLQLCAINTKRWPRYRSNKCPANAEPDIATLQEPIRDEAKQSRWLFKTKNPNELRRFGLPFKHHDEQLFTKDNTRCIAGQPYPRSIVTLLTPAHALTNTTERKDDLVMNQTTSVCRLMARAKGKL